MKFSEHWLRTLVDPPIDSDALADGLTMAGLEVEARGPLRRRSPASWSEASSPSSVTRMPIA